MRLRLCQTAALALTVLTGAAFADVTVSQSNDPKGSIEGEFASLFGAEHEAVSALPAPKLQALASGPKAAEQPVEKPAAEKPAARAAAKAADPVATERGAQPVRQKKPDGGLSPELKLIRYDMAWLASQPSAQGDAEWQCLRTAIYFEARGETLRGQFAVAEVILNRVDSPRYPRSICGVVRQTCQFSYTCDGRSDAMSDPVAADVAGRIARVMMDGAPRALTLGATHFHSTGVRPDWAGRFPRTAAIGAHLFYRQP